jgi:hypothetical protein
MRLVLILACLCAALPLRAEPWHCTFTVTCPAGGDCRGAEAVAEVLPADHEGRLYLITAARSFLAEALTPRTGLPAAYGGSLGEDSAILSIAEDRTAMMTQHRSAGPGVFTLFGTCEEF